MPLANSPEVFGLHGNAEIGYYTTAAKEMWYHLIELQPQTGDVAGGISRDEYIDRVASDVLAKLPKEFELDKLRKKFGIDITPTTVVLLQELERFNNLLRRMQRSLVTLKKVGFCCKLNLYQSFKGKTSDCTLMVTCVFAGVGRRDWNE